MHDLVGAYVLDAVDDRERAAFEAHLAGCADCRREVAELSAPVADLSAGLEETPPEGLRSRLLEQIAQEPQAQEPQAAQEPRALHEDRGVPEPSAAEEPRPGRRRAWWVGIAAAAAVGVGAVVVTQWGTGEPEPAVVAVQDVLDAPDAQRSTETVDGVTVSVVTSASLNRSAFVAEGMEPAPDGQDYQLWFVHEDGTAVSAGLMPRGEQDTSEVVLEGEAAGAVAVGVTLEPAGGSDQPTSDPLVAVPLSG
ncbi:anti-sigma factor [Ornithinicoccus hortensis]